MTTDRRTEAGQLLAHHHHEHHHVVPQGGPVALDIGENVGALIAYVGDEQLGTEIHVRADHDPLRTTHTGVWERAISGRPVVVAVFPELQEDDYGILAPDGSVMQRVSIRGGHIAKVDLRSSANSAA